LSKSEFIKANKNLDLQKWGLQDFSNISYFGQGPVELLLRDNVVVGLRVKGKLDAKTRRKINTLENLEYLDLGQVKGFVNTWAGDLAKLPKLKNLNLWSTSLTNTGMKMLAGSESLEVLDIRETKIKEEGYECLSSVSSLKALRMYASPNIDYSYLKYISRMSNLQMLEMRRPWNVLNNHFIPSDVIKITAGLSNLEELNLDYICKGKESGLDFLNNLPQLKTLSIEYFTFDQASIEIFSNTRELDFLNISNGFIHKVSEANRLFDYLRGIKKLNLQDLTITVIDEAPQEIKHINEVFFRKTDNIPTQKTSRELAERFFPVYKDSYTSVVHNYQKHFAWKNA